MTPASTPRRRLLVAGAAALVGGAATVRAQPGRAAGGRPLIIAQIVDTSPAQQDVSKDFLIGSRAAGKDINTRGGLRGRPVQHLSIDVDGTLRSLRAAVASIKDTPACICLSGTSG